jgi:multimeric flavodoxin WrbA
MLIVGLQGSPRKNGNSHYLLSAFLAAARLKGAQTLSVDVPRRHIEPCKELVVCEKKGYCPIEDDMQKEIYSLLRMADVIVAASPVFFYNVTAQLKALIDRCQTLWARKHKLRLTDPGAKWRKGLFLAVGASHGKQLFTGLELTARYFFDAVAAAYEGSLTYSGIEAPGDIQKHPSAKGDVEKAADRLMAHFTGRRRVLFASRQDACRSQMAAAFAQMQAGDRLEILCAGSEPADKISPVMQQAMAEKGIDMAFRRPNALDKVISAGPPEIIIAMGCDKARSIAPPVRHLAWDLPDPYGRPLDFMRSIRDQIEAQVSAWIATEL